MKILLALLVIFNVIDAFLTNRIILAGAGKESNPFLSNIAGEPAFVIVKAVGAMLCGFILWDVYRRQPRLARICASFFVIAYGTIAVWNLSVLAG